MLSPGLFKSACGGYDISGACGNLGMAGWTRCRPLGLENKMHGVEVTGASRLYGAASSVPWGLCTNRLVVRKIYLC